MAKSLNTFLKSKMNQDLDARLMPKGTYRTAKNVQVSASESQNAGSLENILGNTDILNIQNLTGVNNLYCIGHCVSDETSDMYLFFTDWDGLLGGQKPYYYDPSDNNFIIKYNAQSQNANILVQGAFLNFSKENPIYGVNVLENLLFWTDNRNQPRKINIEKAVSNPNYYNTEDKISVAKYNPYQCIDLFEESYLSTNAGDYESSMKDVVSKSYPNGGFGKVNSSVSAGSFTVDVNSFKGDIVLPSSEYPLAAKIGYTDPVTGEIQVILGATLSTATYNSATAVWTFVIVGASFPDLTTISDIVLNPNPYYNPKFAGDPDFLQEKFVRFSYRFKYEDNEHSLFAPFTQPTFIPEQDGYFLNVKKDNLQEIEDQENSYRSTIVSFMQNKVNSIKLNIPLPFKNYNLKQQLGVKELEILYKESDGTSVKVVDNIPILDIENHAATVTVNGATTASTTITVDNILGGIKIGALVTGFGVTGKPVVTAFDPTDPNNPSSGGDITVDIAQTLVDDVILNINNPDYFVFDYQSKKPYKTLPEADIIRVYDKVPVKALAQEISGNRVIYGNFQDKHTPPEFLNYNVSVSQKSDFDLKTTTAQVQGTFTGTTITIKVGVNLPNVGDFLTLVTGSGIIPENTQVVSITASGGNYTVVLSESVTALTNSSVIFFEPGADTTQTSSIIEYPNHSVKTNRNYQVGVVLSDRYGRSSSVILSNNKDTITVNRISYSGSTIYSPYIDPSIPPSQWPGDSIKLLFNQAISSARNFNLGTPGIYNGDSTSIQYNPLGWYSYKIVVKQTEQEYYNVYLPGIMASYPSNQTLEIGSTSHAVLINDNINKVPRDLSEVGPDQKQFRSSVRLFGRVENTNNTIIPSTDLGSSNKQYYPERFNDVVSTISTVNDLFDYNPRGDDAPRPDYFPQFYDVESNPLIARINTHSKIGQTSTTNYNTVSVKAAKSGTTDVIFLSSLVPDQSITSTITVGDKVLGSGFPDDLVIETPGFTDKELAWPILPATLTTQAASISNEIEVNSIGVGASSAVTVGDLVVDPSSSTTIPSGTVITDITTGGTNPVLTLSNTVSIGNGVALEIYNPPRIKVNKPVTVAFDQNINIVSNATPGIQYLAVYETEPVESLLDIFWESSTTGLISDLNNAVINASSGAATLSSLNSSVFSEGLVNGGEIFSAPFNILDNFGQIVPISDIQETLSIINVFDNEGQEVSSYFNLIQIASNNIWNIEITQDYFDTIFYNYSPNTRVFNFLLRATVNGLETDFTFEAILSNVAPTISLPTQNQTFNVTSNTSLITTITAKNGSANSSLSSIFNNSDCTIISQTNSAGDEVDFFIVPYEYTVDGSGNAIWSLYNNEQGTLPVDTYYLTIQVQDAGGVNDADTVDIILNGGVTVENVYQKIVLTKDFNFPPDSPIQRSGNSFALAYQFVTYFEVTSGPPESLGWYIFNGPFSYPSWRAMAGPYNSGLNPGSPVGYNNSYEPNSYLVNALADENNVLQIREGEVNTSPSELKFGTTEEVAFDEWYNGGGSSQSCRFSQIYPFPSGIPYGVDATPAECNFNPISPPGECVPGMTARVSPYADSNGTILVANGGVLEISGANASQFWLDQYTWGVVT